MKLLLISEASRRQFFTNLLGRPAAAATSSPQPETQNAPSSDLDRRGFMKTTGGTIAANNPLMKLANTVSSTGTIAKDLISKLTDDQLLSTPEHLWVDKIPANRLQRIAQKDPEHGRREIAAKLMKIVSYGLIKQIGIDHETAHKISDQIEQKLRRQLLGRTDTPAHITAEWIKERAHKDAFKGLNADTSIRYMTRHWNTTLSELMNEAAASYYFEKGGAESARQFSDFIRKNWNRYNIKIDINAGEHPTEDPDNWDDGSYNPKKKEKPAEVKNTDKYDDESLGRWESEGGAPNPFESKLASVLNTLYG